MFVPKKGSKRCSCVAIIASLFILEIITSAHTATHSIQIAQQNQFHILGQMEKNDIKKLKRKRLDGYSTETVFTAFLISSEL